MSRSKQAVSYTKPEEPAFLKEIKKRVGYKEGPTVEDKKRRLEQMQDCGDDDEGAVREDEQPQVVVLKEGDGDDADLAEYLKKKKDEEEKLKIESGKIKFKKPTSDKRRSSESAPSDETVATTKKLKTNEELSGKNNNSAMKATNESRLLSFADEDD